MATGKKSFLLYSDLLASIEHLTNEEKGILFNHLLLYVNDKNPVLTDRLLLTAWKPIEMQLKRDLQKFEEVKEKRSEAGKASAEKRAKEREQNSTNPTHVESVQHRSTNPTDNDNVNDTDNVNVNVNEIKNKAPTAVPSFDFKKSFIDLGVNEATVKDFVQVRKTKKAANTETAFNRLKKEIEKSGQTAQECIEIAVMKGWQGFEAEWIKNTKHQAQSKSAAHVHTGVQLEQVPTFKNKITL